MVEYEGGSGGDGAPAGGLHSKKKRLDQSSRKNDIANSHSQSHGWYIVQVRSGQERRMCELIEVACAEYDAAVNRELSIGLTECFNPKFRSQKKWKGSWRDVEYSLIPGYIVAVTDNPERLSEALRTIDDFCMLLTSGGAYEPLADSERAWLEAQTHKGDRVIPMSFATKIGDKLEVNEGPLKGYEGEIVKVDRANSIAHLEFHVGQMTIKTNVGLGVIPG